MGGTNISRAGAAAAAVAAVLALCCAPVPAAATTITVGRHDLATFNDYFHCQSVAGGSCTNIFQVTKTTSAGSMAQIPGDGTITTWRVVGVCVAGYAWCDHRLRVVRAAGYPPWKFVASTDSIHTFGSCDRCAPLDGSDVAVSPGIPVKAGDYLAVDETGSNSADVRVMTATAAGASYNTFSGWIDDGTVATPVEDGAVNYEPLFNADIVLDAPVATAVDPPSGPTVGGQTVSIIGDHLANATHVQFDGVEATDVAAVSDARVTAVAPPHAAGPVNVTVTTAGGTTTPVAGMTYTYNDAPPRETSAYVANDGDGTLWQFDVDPLGQLLAKSPTVVPSVRYASVVVLSPDGRSAYVAGGPSVISQYDVGPLGKLVPKTPPTVTGGPGPWGIAFSPDGRNAYVTNTGFTQDISQFDVGPDGTLTLKSPSSVAAGPDTVDVAVSPDGHSAYGVDNSAGVVFEYDVALDGKLTAKSQPWIPAGTNARAIALSPDGRSAYVAVFGTDSVAQYNVGPAGVLSPKADPTVATGDMPTDVAMSPDGNSIYVADAGGVSQYDVGAGGALTAKAPAAVAVSGGAHTVTVSPDGRSVYAADGSADEVSEFDVGAGGVLVSKSRATVATGRSPWDVAVRPDQPPVAAFTAAAGRPGTATAFNAAPSTDPDGVIARYDWDFGDGATAADAGPHPSHVYAAAGTYQVTLTLTDDIGCSLAIVFTGHTASCNGNPGARVTRGVTVAAPPSGSSGGGSAGVVFAGVPASVAVDRNGRFGVTIHAGSSVRGRAVWRSLRKVRISRRSTKKRLVTLATTSFKVPPGGVVRLRAKLTTRTLRILKLNRKIRTRLTVTLWDAAGHATTVRTTMTLKAPR